MSIKVRVPRDIVEFTYTTKIEPYLSIEGDCLVFSKASKSNRYGYTSVVFPHRERIKLGAHRISYLYHNKRSSTDGLHILHTCDNHTCCNPNHLFLGTHLENMQDKVAKGRSIVQVGDKNNNTKLSEKEVLHIYTSKLPRKTLATMYNTTFRIVQYIQLKYTWKYLTDTFDELMV